HVRALAGDGRDGAAHLGQDRPHPRPTARARGRRQPRVHVLPPLPPLRHRRDRRRARGALRLSREDQRRPHHPRVLARPPHGECARPARPAERPLRRVWPHGMRRARSWIATHPVVAFLVVFAVFPYLVPYKALATQVLIYGLFALGFNLLYGYTGLLSFGHAAYWGLGAYGTGITLAKLQVGSLWLALLAGPALAVVGGVVIGFLCLRRRGIYFAM